MRAFVGFLALLAAMAVGDGSAVSRGVEVTLKAGEGAGAPALETVTLYGASHALVIGIDDYTGGWPRLSNAVKDARAVAEELDRQGFQVTLETNLTASRLDRSLKEFFAIKGSDPEARLLLWFAGHGHTLRGEGFLVPADAPPASDPRFKVRAIHMRDFGGLVRLAESRHVLAVFDSCFSGTIFTSRAGAPPAAITTKTTKPVRQFLTSGDAGQQVRDDGSFRKLFVRALRGEERADANRDGYLTGEELGLFLSQEVAMLTSAAQTPKHGKLHDVEFNQGDFVFVLPEGAGGGSPYQGVRRSAEIVVWQSIKDSTNPAMFEEYIRQFPEGQFSGFARIKLEELKASQVTALPPRPRAPSGEQVRQVQRLLAELGYTPGPADGKAGRNTRAAIEKFQRSNGLDVDGAVTDTLIVRLYAARTQGAAVRPATPPPAEVTPAQPAVGVFPQHRKPGETFKDCPDCPEMVLIPPGSFRMGDVTGSGNNDESPAHFVAVGYRFAVGRFEVTFDEWDACVNDGGCRHRPSDEGWGRKGRPVINVSWKDAKEYVSWLSRESGKRYRLLSEAEWEYMARAGSSTKYPRGITASRARFDSRDGTAPVGSYRSNEFGVYDTVGNVWEWTEDCWHSNYTGAPADGGAWTRGGKCGLRVLRGGSWENDSWFVRSAARSRDSAVNRDSYVGFRVGRTLSEGNSQPGTVVSATGSAAAPAAITPGILPEGTPDEQYKYVFGFLRENNYDKAEPALKAFIATYAANPLASSASYWLGEIYYLRQDYGRAAQTFFDGYKKSPQGPKAASSLLKLGMSLSHIDKREDACVTFAQLEQKFPDASSNTKKVMNREQQRNRCP
jgi:tol-pal system protein YbgF